MLQKMLSRVFLMLALPAALAAQSTTPPPLTGPDHWEIHDENGALPYTMEVALVWVDFSTGIFWFQTIVTDTVTGEVDGDGLVLCDPDNTSEMDAWSGDSGLWYKWVWRGTHYAKVGGSPAVRSYWPVR